MTDVSNSLPLVIVAGGGGRHAHVVLEAALLAGVRVAGVLDLTSGAGTSFAAPVLGGAERLVDTGFLSAHALTPAAGDAGFRTRIAEAAQACGGQLGTVVHPAAVVSPSAAIGAGSVILAGAIVATRARIGDLCIVNHGASVDHDVTLGRAVNVCPGARLAGGVTCGEGAFIGIGAVVIQDRVIGRRAVVGAGAVVIADVADEATVVGSPARRVVRPAP